MVKMAVPENSGIHLYWWPKLPPLSGWHQDMGSSYHDAFYALAPDGHTFNNAKAVMYVKANYKPRDPDVTSVAALVKRDLQQTRKNEAGVVIRKVKPLFTADGKKMITYTFFPPEKPAWPWECVSYGEEGDYYLIFTVSARTKASYKAALPAYKHLIAAYHR